MLIVRSASFESDLTITRFDLQLLEAALPRCVAQDRHGYGLC